MPIAESSQESPRKSDISAVFSLFRRALYAGEAMVARAKSGALT